MNVRTTRSSLVSGLAAMVGLSMAVTVSLPMASAMATTSNPYLARASFSGPLTAGSVSEPLSSHPTGVAENNYVEQEFIASGTAHSFSPVATPSNGKWSIKPASAAAYRTRIIVRRPADAAKFNGTVIVEWMNESEGESAPDWDYLNPYLMNAGYAYVAVSAQALGIEGGTALLGSSSSPGLIEKDPARYGSLHHPGDQYALDIFAQVGSGLRSPTTPVLGSLHPRHVVAVGESQSAFYLTTFADALQPLTHSFDGIFIHSRGGSAAPLNGASISTKSKPVRIRTDLTVPVFMFETQTDLDQLGYAPARQPNTTKIRTWEVAGTSHADTWVVGNYASLLGCTGQINSGPQHTVIQAAFSAFNSWVVRRTAPPSPGRIRLKSVSPTVFATDSHGNVVGGVRTPAVDVPVSTLSNSVPAGSSEVCSLFGSTVPFSAAQLTSIYGTHASYMASYRASLNRAIAKGFILPADKSALLAEANAVNFGT
jgi:Alpha/beta hydrolase domain